MKGRCDIRGGLPAQVNALNQFRITRTKGCEHPLQTGTNGRSDLIQGRNIHVTERVSISLECFLAGELNRF